MEVQLMSDQSTHAGQQDPEIQAALQRIHARAVESINAGGLDNLSVKELRLQALQQVEAIQANDQKASVVGTIVLVVVVT
jgi:hypothetical protein